MKMIVVLMQTRNRASSTSTGYKVVVQMGSMDIACRPNAVAQSISGLSNCEFSPELEPTMQCYEQARQTIMA